ncbi:MAG: hypothetical protein UFG06_13890 [Lachnospiraceae bacterium]|nr:hypothetical protein [Lachnospiraceae bacterium]
MLLTAANSVNWINIFIAGLKGFFVGIYAFFATLFSSPYLTAFFIFGVISTFIGITKRRR